MNYGKKSLYGLALVVLFICSVTAKGAVGGNIDLSKEKVLYAVGYAHLDTQWRWDYVTTIDVFLKDTLDGNFRLFEKYPGYVFNFTGSTRYELMKEYYPQKYEKLKEYIKDGRWFVSGSSVDEGDINVPVAESVIRQILYGNEYFRKEFGKESSDYILPDCFGFPAAMPSIWAHCGLNGFSTQKLTWGSAVGIPFNIGVWEGVDGKSVIAAFNPGSYVGSIKGRVDLNQGWADRVEYNGANYGVYADYHYYGVGDRGGAPREKDVKNYLASIDNKDSKFRLVLTSSDQMYKDITEEQRQKLPIYRGDLLLTEHSAGTLTSQAYMKRWNRKNEILADAAERAAVAATWLGASDYPLKKLNKSWRMVLGSQMHDILPGTSLPKAYEYSWNDEVIALNGFASVLSDSVGAVCQAMDTDVKGKAIVVYNPLAIDRKDPVQAMVSFPEGVPATVGVYDWEGKNIPCQVISRTEKKVEVLFVANIPSVGFACYDVRSRKFGTGSSTGLKVSRRTLENNYYKVSVGDNGDVVSVFDKKVKKELLAAPARLEFLKEYPRDYPAWNMDWNDRKKDPIAYVDGQAKIRIAEDGPVRVTLEIERQSRSSFFTQQIRLYAGDAGRRVEFNNIVDWQSKGCSLKAAFPLTVSSDVATYNMTLGTIDRRTNDPKKYEVPSHEWFDLNDGQYGVSILEDCKFGSDKPNDNTLRLTLLYTPKTRGNYVDQHSQDWGVHEFVYALYGHKGDWRQGRSEWQGRRLNQPLIAFQTPKHNGSLGKTASMFSVDSPQIDIRAIKKAENSDYVIIRLQELWGRDAKNVKVSSLAGFVEAYEVDGQERKIGSAVIKNGKLVLDATKYSPRTFAVKLGKPSQKFTAPVTKTVALDFNADVISSDKEKKNGAFDDQGRTIPAEMLPVAVVSESINFEIGPKSGNAQNAVVCKGQTVSLPGGNYNRLYLLAAAAKDTSGKFVVGGKTVDLSIQSWTGYVGQYDNRIWDREFAKIDYTCSGKVVGITPGFIKRDNIAWFCTHRHRSDGSNDSYQFSYLFKYSIDLPEDARTIRLPENPDIKILAITVAENKNDSTKPAQPLYDNFDNRKQVELRNVYTSLVEPKSRKALGKVTVDRKDSFKKLVMGPVSTGDYADFSSGNGVKFSYVKGDDFSVPRSDMASDTLMQRLYDGKVAGNNDDVHKCVWLDGGQGRIVVDLQKQVCLEKVNTYSWHKTNRAPQKFSLWASSSNQMPDCTFSDKIPADWQYLATVDSYSLRQGGIHGSSVELDSSKRFKYLLYIIEDAAEGPFLTEVDIYVQ